MQPEQLARAVAAGASAAVSLGLDVRDTVVLSSSNKITARLVPCDAVARIAPAALDTADAELDIARQLQSAGAPIAPLDPRVPPSAHHRDGFVITFWAHVDTSATPTVSVQEYAGALRRLHRALRTVDVVVPHIIDRIRTCEQLLAGAERTPHLAPEDRDFLREVLAAGSDRMRDGGGQVLHGEPHRAMSSPPERDRC